MKKTISVFFTLLILLSAAAAEKLPDGTVVDGSIVDISQKKSLQYRFKSPVNLKTPYGIIPVSYISFNADGSPADILFADKQMIDTPAGRLYVKEVSFGRYDSKNYPERVYLGESVPVKIPIGEVRLEENDILEFDCFGFMYGITIENSKKRELHTKYGVLKAERYIGIDQDKSSSLRIYLAEPAEIATSAGKLVFTRDIWFHRDGTFRSGFLLKPQKIKTAAGKAVINSITFNQGGSIFNLTLNEPAELQTLWGIFKVKGNLRLSENGIVDSGQLESPREISFAFGKIKARDSFYIDYDGNKSLFYLSGDAEITTPLGRLTVTENISIDGKGNAAGFNPVSAITVDTPYGRFTSPPRTRVWVYPDGKINSFTMTGPEVIETHAGKLKVNGMTGFHNNGMIRQTTILDPVTINTAAGKCTVKDYAEFYPDGRLKFCSLVRTTSLKISGGNVKVSGGIYFHQDGSFKSGKLDAPVRIGGVSYPRRYTVELDSKGNVISPKPGR